MPNILSRIFNRGTKVTTAPGLNPNNLFMPFPSMYVPSELRLTPDEYESLSVVWACMRVIAEGIATSKAQVFQPDIDGRRELVCNDPIAKLFNYRPNKYTTGRALIESLMTQALIYGDSYAEIVFDGGGRVFGLHPLLSQNMLYRPDPESDPADPDFLYFYADPTGRTVILHSEQVFHLRGLSKNGVLGESLIAHAARAIATGVAAEKFAGSYFANGANPSGFIATPNVMQQEVRDRFLAGWKKSHGGSGKQGGIALLENGMTYQAVGSNAEQAQIVPSRVFTVEDVARVFGVPLVKLGVPQAATGYGTNVSELNLAFIRDTLEPWADRLEEEATYKLFGWNSTKELEFDLSWLSAGNLQEKADVAKTLVESGILTINEARETLGYNPIGPEGDVSLIPTKMLPKPEPEAEQADATSDGTEEMPTDGQDMPGMENDSGMQNKLPEGALEALSGHSRRIKARRADLERVKKTPDQIKDNLSKLTDRATKELLALGMSQEVSQTFAQQVTDGIEPERVLNLLGAK